jgi:hypothetical protein
LEDLEMAILAGNIPARNKQLTLDVPSVKIDVGEQYGRVRRAYDEYVGPAGDNLGTSAVVQFMKLPAGARIVDARWIGPNITGGAVNVGWAANGVDDADADGLFAAAATSMAAAKDLKLAATADGYNKRFGAETQIQAAVTTQTNDLAGEKIALEVFFVVD